jgi:nucleotide-binding universal stress UspA family protein
MKILCASDLGPASVGAVNRACSLAQRLPAELSVVHAVSATGSQGATLEQRVWRAEATLRGGVAGQPCHPRTRVRVGHPGRRIVEATREANADLVVLGAPAVKSANSFRQSIADRVLAEAHKPVLVVPREPEGEYRRVMLALDISRESAAALRLAETLALAGDEITFVVHAFEPPYEGMLSTVGVSMQNIEAHAHSWRNEIAVAVREFLQRVSRDPARYRLILAERRPVPGILDAAERLRPDLLMLGSRAQGPLLRTLLGSVGSRVAGAAGCDVLLVPEGIRSGTAA